MQVKLTGLEELLPDISTVLAGIDYIRTVDEISRNQILKDFVLHLLAEFGHQSQDNDREYRRSSYYILNQLFESGVVVKNEKGEYKVQLDQVDSLCNKAKKDLETLIHENSTPDLYASGSELLNIKKSDNAKVFINDLMTTDAYSEE